MSTYQQSRQNGSEYLNYVTQSSATFNMLKCDAGFAYKTGRTRKPWKLLYDKIQAQPDVEVYPIYWSSDMQQKIFMLLYSGTGVWQTIQGREKSGSSRVALDNEDYDNALKVYRYVIRFIFQIAKRIISTLGTYSYTRGPRRKHSINKDSADILIDDYMISKQYPDNINSLEAARRKHCFCKLPRPERSAIQIINKLLLNPRTSCTLSQKPNLT
jgi:hypothetical protein